jgi:phosphohistidine phosphatase
MNRYTKQHHALFCISNLPDTAQTVLLFGHNPAFTEVANLFTHDFIENVPTCGVVRIETTAESWSRMYEGNAKVVACYFPKDVL